MKTWLGSANKNHCYCTNNTCFYLRDFFFTHFGFKDGFQETTTRPSRMNKYRNWWQLLSSERIVKYNWTNILIMTLSFPSHFVICFGLFDDVNVNGNDSDNTESILPLLKTSKNWLSIFFLRQFLQMATTRIWGYRVDLQTHLPGLIESRGLFEAWGYAQFKYLCPHKNIYS